MYRKLLVMSQSGAQLLKTGDQMVASQRLTAGGVTVLYP